MSIIGTIYEDVTTDVLGDIGSWQWLVTFLSTVITLPCFFNHHEDLFMLTPSQTFCIPPEGADIHNQTLCSYTQVNSTREFACTKWRFKLMWMFWIEKSWLVFCDHRTRLISTALIVRLGLVFGFIIFGLVSDSFGRKKAILIDAIAELVWRIAQTFCYSEAWYRLVVFLRALFGCAKIYMGLVLTCEVASNRWRSWLTVIVMMPRLLAMVCMVPLANCSPNQETYSFFGCICGTAAVFMLRWTPESPQWLLYNRKIPVAEELLYSAAARNGISFSAEFKIRPVNHRAYNCLDENTSCVGVLTTHNIRVIILLCLLFWILHYYLWSSLYLRIYYTNGFANNIMLKLLCFFGVIGSIVIFLSKKIKLRQLLCLNVLLTGTFAAGMTFFKQESVRGFMSSLALSSGLIVHGLILNITPRLFATNVRATLFGCCHAIGQIGTMISYLVLLFHVMDDLVFASMNIVVSLALVSLCLLLPDVDGRELPDIMEDMDYYSELTKPLRWATQKTSHPSKEEVEMRVYSFASSARNISPQRSPPQPIGILRAWNRLNKGLSYTFGHPRTN